MKVYGYKHYGNFGYYIFICLVMTFHIILNGIGESRSDGIINSVGIHIQMIKRQIIE